MPKNNKFNENELLKSAFSFELLSKENKISIIMNSFDENINYAIICKVTDKFYDIENKFYEKYKEYKNLVKYFVVNGKIINKEKNLEENGIQDNYIIYISDTEKK